MINMRDMHEYLKQKSYSEVLNDELKPLIEIDKRKHFLKEALTWPLELCFAKAILCPFHHDLECFFWASKDPYSKSCFYDLMNLGEES